jgi:hypothetical protein
MSKKELEKAFKKLEELISWHEYYSGQNNPIEANKVQKEIEQQKRILKDLKNGETQEVPER